MALGDDLKSQVEEIFRKKWGTRKRQKVPESADLQLGNEAVNLEATVLYADMSKSTALVDEFKANFAAEIYKAYLHSAAKIIRSEGGAITSYDGDRIMAVFIGGTKNTSATRAGLKINYATKNIVNPAIKDQYKTDYQASQVVGIDTGAPFVARTGIRGSNDLVWVGRAANYAAKLTELPSDHPTWMTASEHEMLHESTKATKGRPMWEARRWTAMGGHSIYCSNWSWKP